MVYRNNLFMAMEGDPLTKINSRKAAASLRRREAVAYSKY